MKRMKRWIAMSVVGATLSCSCVPCFAGESEFVEIFQDAGYGGLTGALVGAAILAFRDKPQDHLNYILYGAAAGVLVGVTYGVVKTTKAVAEVDNGHLKLALPTIVPSFDRADSKGRLAYCVGAEVLRAKF